MASFVAVAAMLIATNSPSRAETPVSTDATAACPCTGFLPTDTPEVTSVTDNAQLELGVKFRTTQAGFITGIRFYKGDLNRGTHIAHLWSATGTLLAEATFTGETPSGWQEVKLATAVPVVAGVTYLASYHSTGSYAYTSAFFGSAVVNGPLRLLASGEDGPNGVFEYGSSRFPVSSFNNNNYWVDVVFNTSVPADGTPPVVTATAAAANESGVAINAAVTATFSEALAPATVTAATFVLRTAAQTIVPATITYDTVARTAKLKPNSPLAYATAYMATLKGSAATSPHINDIAGNALAADFTWSFTTTAAPPPAPTDGPGGPVLVISTTVNAFSRYPVEMLRAEGFNLFAAQDISAVTAAILNGYDVAILGDMTLTAAQVTMLTTWVNAGGTLIALHPSKLLASLMGLTDASATLSDRYLKVNTASGAGVGIEGQTMQYHGTADLYTLSGATAVATLYSNATTATSNPAVTTRTVGANGGRAIAFTFDLARSIVTTRQGNPAWAGQERDGLAPKRSDDLFFGAAAADPQPDWVDLSKVAIPQADEQQRLLGNLLIQGNLHRKPLPRFWYFPKGKKAVVVMTGDDHGDAGMVPRFDTYRLQSPVNCSLPDWECVTATGYEYVGSGYTDPQAQFYTALGQETALHVSSDCLDFTRTSFEANLTTQLPAFAGTFPNIPPPATNRTHCIAWSDWSSEAELESSHGLRLDTNYYYFPPSWVNDRPGLFTGSGIPMRFAKVDGALIDCYQLTTQMTDESGQTYPMTADSLLARALDARGYYGAFCANMHFDHVPEVNSDQIVASAVSRGVPVVSARQMLTWLDGRGGSSFSGVSWSGSTLSFTIAVGSGARNLQAMLPRQGPVSTLAHLTRNGVAVAFTLQTIKGIEYAFFPADPGLYGATYAADATAPTITLVTATANTDGGATVTWTTNEIATSTVTYGTTSSSLTLSTGNPALVTSHSVKLTRLTGATKYFYRVVSADNSLNSATSPNPPSAPASFTTVANAAPVANAVGVPANGSSPLVVNFSGATSTDANNDSLTFTWGFGDGGSATGRRVSHTYLGVGGFAALLTVTDNRGGSDTASVWIVAAAPAFPQTAVLDGFDRADGPPGANWLDETSAFAVSGATLVAPGGSGHVEWGSAAFGTTQEAFVTFYARTPSAAEQNLMLKTQGASWTSGHISVSYNGPGSKVVVYTLTPPGTWTTRGTIGGVTFVTGDRLGARAYADGTVQVFRNATLIGSVSVAGWPFAAMGGRIGISCVGATATQFESFGGGTVPGSGTVLDAPRDEPLAPPPSIALSSPYPNPARGVVALSLELPRETTVNVRVLDVMGRQVWSAPEKRYAAGRWTLGWDGRGPGGPVRPGMYLMRVRAGDAAFARRFVIVR